MSSFVGLSRKQYMSILLNKGFIFEKTQVARPSSLGDEDVYLHPQYKTKFYITRRAPNRDYGLNPQKKVGDEFDSIVPHNVTGSYKDYPFWVGQAFTDLMDKI